MWEDPSANIVNVKLVVGRRVQISHKPIRGPVGGTLEMMIDQLL